MDKPVPMTTAEFANSVADIGRLEGLLDAVGFLVDRDQIESAKAVKEFYDKEKSRLGY